MVRRAAPLAPDGEGPGEQSGSDAAADEEEEEENPLGEVSFQERLRIVRDGSKAINPHKIKDMKKEALSQSLKSKKKKQGNSDKGAPVELSAKMPVSRKRQVVPNLIPKRRDPRFNDRSGCLNEGGFDDAYGFVLEIKKRELAELKQEMRSLPRSLTEEERREEKSRLGKAVSILSEQIKAAEEKKLLRDLKKTWKSEQEDRIREGKRLFYLKPSDVKKRLRDVKKDKLHEQGGDQRVVKYEAKVRKRRATKDRKKPPRKVARRT